MTTQQSSPAAVQSLQSCPEILRRVYGLVDYLYHVVTGGLLTQEVARRAWQAWSALSDANGNALSVPDACPGPDGQLLYTWDRDEHHLELEIFPEDPSEFFYRNRTTGELWECEYINGEPPPKEAMAKLGLFV